MLASLVKSYRSMYDAGQGGAFEVAESYARLGDKEQALRYLRLAFERKELWMEALQIDRDLAILHDEPAFLELRKKLGLEGRNWRKIGAPAS